MISFFSIIQWSLNSSKKYLKEKNYALIVLNTLFHPFLFYELIIERERKNQLNLFHEGDLRILSLFI